VQLDGEAEHLFLQVADFGGVLGLVADLLAEMINFGGPTVLMGLLAQLGALGA
jgi:hypothetical protein